MCRLFGVISTQGFDAANLLEGADHSLLYQSRISRKELQKDGWGIGWFEDGRPSILKSPKTIYRDRKLLMHAARKASGKVLLGHVRWASNPMKLPRHQLIGMKHTQPFQYKRWLFVHNGTLLIPREVRAELGPLAAEIRGNNDSEILFYWLIKHLGNASPAQIVSGIRRSLKNLNLIWEKCRNKYPLYKYPYHGLNCVLTDGKMMIAMCYVNAGGIGKSKAFCARRQPYYQLQISTTPTEVCVASEPLDAIRPWRAMKHGEILIAKRMANSVSIKKYNL